MGCALYHTQAMGKLNAFFFNPPLEANWWGHIFSEVYKDKIFEPFLKGKTGLTILDIGANVGITSYYFSQFAKRVISLEPSLEHFQVLSQMVEHNDLGHIIEPVNKAIYMKSGQFPFFHNQNRTMYSLHQSVNDNSSAPELVQAITLEDLLKEKEIEQVDFMKLDIEGSEHEVLGSESFRNVAPKIKVLVIEHHQWSGRHPNQINEALKANGYQVSTMPSSAEIIVGVRK